MNKIPFLIFEGADKSGKDTLIREFHKATNFQYPCINRFFGTSYAYGKLWKRKLDFSIYFSHDFAIRDKALLIYLYTSTDETERRFHQHNENDIKIDQLKELTNFYEEYLNITGIKYITIDTSLPIKECVDSIIRFLDCFNKNDIFIDIIELEKYVNNFGEKISNTKEVRNIQLEFENFNIDEIYDYMHRNNIYKKEEEEEYEMIYSILNNTIRLKTEYFKNQTIESRQFIYHGDSCISLFQVMKRGNILEVFVTLRSSNIKDMLYNDVAGIHNISTRLNQKYFNCDKIQFHLQLNSAHVYI